MTAKLNPYLHFKGDARAAMEFYAAVFGGDLRMMTFKEMNAEVAPDDENLVMHASLETSSGFTLMGSDAPSHMETTPFGGFSISLSGDDEDELSGYFAKLSAGGTITTPLEKAMWGDTFGMCVDKFGVNWLVNIAPAK